VIATGLAKPVTIGFTPMFGAAHTPAEINKNNMQISMLLN
jgi:hypothetical protein